jgi:beta-lactamase class A
MKRNPWSVIIPLLLSFLVLFFLFKKETTTSDSTSTPVFRIRKESSIYEEKETEDEIDTESQEFNDMSNKIQNETGTFGLYIKDLNTNKEYEFNPNEQFYPLSLFKLPLAYIVVRDAEKGDLKLDDLVEYKKEDYYDGFGTIGMSGVGSEFRYDKVLELMIRESDNTAPNMLKRKLGEEYLNEEFKKITGDKNADLFDEYLYTTPKKCSRVTEGIFYKKWINDSSVNLLLSFMYPTSYDTTITPYLDESLTFYHKVGIMPGMYHNCGIIKGENTDILLCLMSKDITEESFNNVSKLVAEFINGL